MAATSDIRIASIGDFCVDDYVDSGESYLGGTAFNVAVQARRAGAQASVLSAIGSDAFADQFMDALNALQINTERLQRSQDPTSRVVVRLDESKTPTFEAWELGALTNFRLTQADGAFLAAHHAARNILLIGMETQFDQFCAFDLPNTLKVADFAGGSEYSVGMDEVMHYAPRLDIVVRSIEDDGEREALERLSRTYPCLVIGTLGKAGSIAFKQGEKFLQAATSVEAVDTTGAGDAYIAHFVVNYVKTKDIQASMRRATQAAAEKVQEKGASSYDNG